MIYSMTGFASMNQDIPNGNLSLDLRAVNHRYLDIQIRMPEDLRPYEARLREIIASRVQRGKIECRINVTQSDSAPPQVEINPMLVQQLLMLSDHIQMHAPSARGFSVNELLRWPGMIETKTTDSDTVGTLCLAQLPSLLDEFCASRQREGEKLKAVILERVAAIYRLIDDLKPRVQDISQAWQTRLQTRLQEALGHAADDERLKQEFALFAQKIDIDEELDRLHTHLTEIQRVLTTGGQVGKRLDFLMQELNREANTLGSKSVSTETTMVSVELKVLIEQMREQIQNLE